MVGYVALYLAAADELMIFAFVAVLKSGISLKLKAMTESVLLNGVDTGLNEPPQDDHEDFQITRDEFDQLQRALKNEQFRNMLNEYAEEVQVGGEIFESNVKKGTLEFS